MAKRKSRLTLSAQLREYVRDSGLTPTEIHRRTGISKSMLAQFSKGTKFLGKESMDKICELLNLELVRKE